MTIEQINSRIDDFQRQIDDFGLLAVLPNEIKMVELWKSAVEHLTSLRRIQLDLAELNENTETTFDGQTK